MSFALDLQDLCVQTIVWKAASGRDRYGKPAFSAPQTFPGRRVFKRVRVSPTGHKGIIGAGPEVLGESTIYILGTPAVGYDDQVYVDGDDTTRLPPVLEVDRYPDETGDVYVKVVLGDANG